MEANWKKLSSANFKHNFQSSLKAVSSSSHISQSSKLILSICKGSDIPQAKRSTIARFRISKYVPRRWSCRCFANTMTIKRFKMTTERDSIMGTIIHRMHCDFGIKQAIPLLLVAIAFQPFFSEGRTHSCTLPSSKWLSR